MKRALECGPRKLVELADELGSTDETRGKLIDTMDREVRRKKHLFTKITKTSDNVHRIALVSNRPEVA